MSRITRKRLLAAVLLFALLAFPMDVSAQLRMYWCDVEGGAATLIVTPDGESVLIDAGNPGERDSGRIHKLATEVAGLERIDHMVVTHFDGDHYGGVPDLAKRMPIGHFYDPGIPEGNRRVQRRVGRYRAATDGKRTVLKPGDRIPLKTDDVTVRCLAAAQRFVGAPASSDTNSVCETHEPKEKDRSENANSVVLLVSYGKFRLLDAADLTWELEKQLVCPVNLVGKVDVYQVDHHGLSNSNNPVLVKTVEPRVAIMNNGARKGCTVETVNTLRTTPSIEAIYQLHLHERVGRGGNTFREYIANMKERCDAHHVELIVAPDGSSYTVSVPRSGHWREFATK